MTLAFEAAELPADAIEVGRIADAWGIKGWFKVLPYSASPEALFSSKRWYLQPSERGAKTFEGTVLLRVREAKEHADSVVACAEDIPDRNAAEALRGADEAFVTGTFAGLIPVRIIDGRPVRNPLSNEEWSGAGPVSQRLSAAYKELCAKDARRSL